MKIYNLKIESIFNDLPRFLKFIDDEDFLYIETKQTFSTLYELSVKHNCKKVKKEDMVFEKLIPTDIKILKGIDVLVEIQENSTFTVKLIHQDNMVYPNGSLVKFFVEISLKPNRKFEEMLGSHVDDFKI